MQHLRHSPPAGRRADRHAAARIYPSPRTALSAAAITAGAGLMYFAGLGRNPLLDPDEPIYGQFVKEMVRGGDWLTPHYAGQLWFDKPPLFYWFSSLSVSGLGCSEFALRLPSAISAVLVAVLVYLLTRHDFGRRAGLLASVVAGTSLLQMVVSHAASTDALMLACMCAALYAYRRWLDSASRGRLAWGTACGAAAGLGMLTKGPAVPLLLATTFVIHLLWTRQLARLRELGVAAGVGAAMLVGLPWYVAMYAMHGRVFVDQFMIANNIGRYLEPLHKSQSGHWYSHLTSLFALLALFLPWSPFLPQAIARGWRRGVGAKLALCWAAVVLAFFSLSTTQNFTYSLPAFPGCALLVGVLLDDEAGKSRLGRTISAGVWAGLATMVLMAAAMLVVVRTKFPAHTLSSVPAACALVAVFAVPAAWMLVRRERSACVPWMIAAGMVVFNLVTLYGLMPGVAEYKSSKQVARRIRSERGVNVATVSLWRPGLFYYLDRKPTELRNPDEIRRLATSRTPALVVCEERDEKEVERHIPVEVYGCGDLDVYANSAYLLRDLVRAGARTSADQD